MHTGKTEEATADLGRPAGPGRVGRFTNLPASQGTLRDHFPGIHTVRGPRVGWGGGFGIRSRVQREADGEGRTACRGAGLEAWRSGLELSYHRSNYFTSLTLVYLSVKCQ